VVVAVAVALAAVVAVAAAVVAGDDRNQELEVNHEINIFRMETHSSHQRSRIDHIFVLVGSLWANEHDCADKRHR
jgi:hypothetical protein